MHPHCRSQMVSRTWCGVPLPVALLCAAGEAVTAVAHGGGSGPGKTYCIDRSTTAHAEADTSVVASSGTIAGEGHSCFRGDEPRRAWFPVLWRPNTEAAERTTGGFSIGSSILGDAVCEHRLMMCISTGHGHPVQSGKG